MTFPGVLGCPWSAGDNPEVPRGLRVQCCDRLVTPQGRRPQRQPHMAASSHVDGNDAAIRPLFMRRGARAGMTVMLKIIPGCQGLLGHRFSSP
jgi:hypothetical protein